MKLFFHSVLFSLVVFWGSLSCLSIPPFSSNEIPQKESLQEKQNQETSSDATFEAPTENKSQEDLPPENKPQDQLPPNILSLFQKKAQQDLRILSYNIEKDSVFIEGNGRQPKFIRILQSVKPDIVALQEVSSSPEEVVRKFNTWLPLGDNKTWYAAYAGSTMTVSQFPFTRHDYKTEPWGGRKVSLTWIDLPDSIYSKDLYLMNNHFTCCGGNDRLRQEEADQLVHWIRDLKNEGGNITLPAKTPFIILGDLNLVEGYQPLKTILDGNIINEATYGADISPDWDNTSLTNLNPTHNGQGKDFYTWRWDGGAYEPNQIDFVLYADSVLTAVQSFILNTLLLSEEELKTLGLQKEDSTKSKTITGGWVFDHLPIVVDFRLK